MKLFLYVFVAISLASCDGSPNVPDVASTNSDKPIENEPARAIPGVELSRKTNFTDYEVIMHPVNLSNTDYKKDVEEIIDALAAKYGRKVFTAWIYDSKMAADMNYRDLQLGERISKAEETQVNEHIVAVFSKSFANGRTYISYFENIPEAQRSKHLAWKNAFNESEFEQGYVPK